MNKESPTPRKRLMETAADLFYRQGFRAVGVDTIAAESGVGKMTLYRHFESKEDLIVAYLEESHRQFWTWFETAMQPAETPADKLLAFFQALQDLTTKPSCHGCPFLNAVVDFPEADHPGHRVALTHKQSVRRRFLDLVTEARAAQPETLADQLFLLMDGAFMAVRMYGQAGPARETASAAQALLNAQITK
jgi:AcrR family transcriptional regulator